MADVTPSDQVKEHLAAVLKIVQDNPGDPSLFLPPLWSSISPLLSLWQKTLSPVNRAEIYLRNFIGLMDVMGKRPAPLTSSPPPEMPM